VVLVFWLIRNLIFVLLRFWRKHDHWRCLWQRWNVEEDPHIKQLDLNTNHDSYHLETPTYEDIVTKRERIFKQKYVVLATLSESKRLLKCQKEDRDCLIDIFVRNPVKGVGPRRITVMVGSEEICNGKAWVMLKRLKISATGKRVLFKYESSRFVRERPQHNMSNLVLNENAGHMWTQTRGRN